MKIILDEWQKEEIMKLIEKCNHWQPDYKFACVDKTKLKDLLDR